MRIPDSLLALIDEGILSEVVRPLMSGKEAKVFLVQTSSGMRVAKVYKDAEQRSFKQRADYTEGRTVRNSRDQRAMQKRTRYGREQDEAAWRSAEVDMIYRLRAAGVRVPEPHLFVDGVLIMEFVCDAYGNPAPRLGDVQLAPTEAQRIFDHLIGEVTRMLAAGVVHGDLSDFNVLLGKDGPVIIDFPQSVNASNNLNARRLLVRDVDNLHRFCARFLPSRIAAPLAQEMWHLYERGELTPETKLTGRYRAVEKQVSTTEVSSLIADAAREGRPRRPVVYNVERPAQNNAQRGRGPVPGARRDGAQVHSAPQRGAPRPVTPREQGNAQRALPAREQRGGQGQRGSQESAPRERVDAAREQRGGQGQRGSQESAPRERVDAAREQRGHDTRATASRDVSAQVQTGHSERRREASRAPRPGGEAAHGPGAAGPATAPSTESAQQPPTMNSGAEGAAPARSRRRRRRRGRGNSVTGPSQEG